MRAKCIELACTHERAQTEKKKKREKRERKEREQEKRNGMVCRWTVERQRKRAKKGGGQRNTGNAGNRTRRAGRNKG